MKISKITRICMENHSSVTGWQELLFILLNFGGRCNRYFWDIRLKIYRLPNFNMLFQLVLTKCFKSELFSLIFHSDHGRSNEPMNPLWTRIHRLIWSTMIQVIRIADPDPDHPKGKHPKSWKHDPETDSSIKYKPQEIATTRTWITFNNQGHPTRI